MPLTIVSTDDTDGIGLTSGTDLTVLAGVTVSSAGDALDITSGTYNNGHVTILGALVAGNYGIDLDSSLNPSDAVNGSTFYIGSTGQIIAGNIAILMEDGTTASPIINYGEIFGHNRALFLNSSSAVGAFDIANHGTMSSGENETVLISNFNEGSLLNTGMMTNMGGDEVVNQSSGGALDLTNSGTISTNGSTAILSFSVADIFNSGDILGGITLSIFADVITNSGLVDGDLTLGNGTDAVENGGQIYGDVDLGNDADTYLAVGAGTVSGAILGGAGEDSILGGTQADLIDGGTEADIIRGRAGDDVVYGGAGNDTLRTGQGDDILDGGTGNDFMRGGAGDDVLIGGLGQDTMFGNAGADTFVFNSASESTNAGAAWDRIMDFDIGQDLIDLSAFNARFIGTAAYAGNGNIAEVRIFADPNGDTRVFVDVNADGTADMRFYLVNTVGITAEDFIL
ncbi:MAG: calcium-binding protein [Sulfitobacter sp.]